MLKSTFDFPFLSLKKLGILALNLLKQIPFSIFKIVRKYFILLFFTKRNNFSADIL